MSGPGPRMQIAWPFRGRLPGRRRALVAVFAVGLVAVAAATLLLGPRLAANSGVFVSDNAFRLPLAASPSQSPSPADASPSASVTPSPTAQELMTPLVLVPPRDLTGYVWPLVNAHVTLPFGPTSWGEMIVDGQRFHDGLDISTGCGPAVLAAHDGVVLAAGRQYDDFVGWEGDLTPYYDWLTQHKFWNTVPIVVVIDDGNGYRSIYAHESSVTVQPGQHVNAGERIGYEGKTGLATGCHVHFSLYSPLETRTFALDPGVVQRDQMPPAEIARIDPLLVLPFRCDVEEMVALRPYEAASCPTPTKRPPPKPTPTKAPAASGTAAPTAGVTDTGTPAPKETPSGTPTPAPPVTPEPTPVPAPVT
ncbi:MAG TPA: M23 family metallopeptidase [Candidatus Limnocylindrales bacterium]|nr:M23 family metallopeptidase [Candidatus Limnocylindrales bacterium]